MTADQSDAGVSRRAFSAAGAGIAAGSIGTMGLLDNIRSTDDGEEETDKQYENVGGAFSVGSWNISQPLGPFIADYVLVSDRVEREETGAGTYRIPEADYGRLSPADESQYVCFFVRVGGGEDPSEVSLSRWRAESWAEYEAQEDYVSTRAISRLESANWFRLPETPELFSEPDHAAYDPEPRNEWLSPGGLLVFEIPSHHDILNLEFMNRDTDEYRLRWQYELPGAE